MTNLVFFTAGFIIGVLILCIYIIFDRRNLKSKFEDEVKFYQLVESSKDVLYHYEVKPEFKFRYISPSLEYLLGEGTIEMAYNDPYAVFEHIHPDDYQTLYNKVHGDLDYSQPITQRWRNDKGNYVWFEEYATPIYHHGVLVAIKGVMRNMTNQIKLQQDLEYQITHDDLTGLYNRRYLSQQLDELDEKKNEPCGLIVCDLDDLKKVNDSRGHKMGDQLIIEAAKILESISKDNVIVSRLGGDEFAILVTCNNEAQIELMIEEILNKVNRYNSVKDSILKISISIGYAFSSYSIGMVEELFNIADKNMYKEKNSKKFVV
ncbi:sensor domain-containing diguanylate cyclase [Litchfieldia salsa]|uniref:PAS domain S-box-containing protein/diguanylate cyclase (GGDEF) domain-containing protein n=1 Tax=Litchfieldia salsa TaxID=930152 RepID=A0A1H0VXG7_9BACI|nr:sensor domain-containing diguanylate cyclase [Litchfieldia salsa]SDP82908.1 PAS domain S-box-containing protein/diguanylate cyclase (GGDEF) domain-containing protein [Litchfieldia salsa]